MKLGLVTDSLVDRSLAEAAAVCRGLGLEQVELGCGNWSPAPHVDLKGLTADAGARHRLLDTLGENGLTISALNCSGNPLFPGEKGAGDRAVAEGTFLLAEQLGVETVVMMSGLPGGCPEDRTPTWIVTSWPPETEEILRYQWKAAVPVWKALAARARDHGVKRIALEFHGWQLVYNVETLRRLRSEVGDDILGVNLDPTHLFWMGADPVEVARALADCIYHVHIKDVRLEPAAGQNTLLALPGKPIPSTSVRQFIVLAVNRPEQLPQPGHAACSMMLSSVLSIFPASKRPAASKTVETLMSVPLRRPGSIGPPLTTIAGILRRAAAISIPGTILSQFGMSTRPSNA